MMHRILLDDIEPQPQRPADRFVTPRSRTAMNNARTSLCRIQAKVHQRSNNRRPAFRRDYFLGGTRLDFYLPLLRIAVQICQDESNPAYLEKEWERDKRLLERYGVVTFRYPARQLVESPETLEEEISAAVDLGTNPRYRPIQREISDEEFEPCRQAPPLNLVPVDDDFMRLVKFGGKDFRERAREDEEQEAQETQRERDRDFRRFVRKEGGADQWLIRKKSLRSHIEKC